MSSPAQFTPAHFLALVERERHWCELLITAIATRHELRDLQIKLVADDSVAVAPRTSCATAPQLNAQ